MLERKQYKRVYELKSFLESYYKLKMTYWGSAFWLVLSFNFKKVCKRMNLPVEREEKGQNSEKSLKTINTKPSTFCTVLALWRDAMQASCPM